jgi:hypothetical protein
LCNTLTKEEAVAKETVLSVVKELRDSIKELIKLLAGRPILSAPFENKRFIQNADGTFTDKKRSMIWAKEDLPTKMTPAEAIEACKKLGPGWVPFSDEEFESIKDRTRYNPAIIPEAEVLGLKTDDWYVTRTPFAGDSDGAWFVGPRFGDVDYCNKGYHHYVRPVRVSQ